MFRPRFVYSFINVVGLYVRVRWQAVSVVERDKVSFSDLCREVRWRPFMVCGSLACWLQADPELTHPKRQREIIRNTSVTDDFTGELSSEGDKHVGYGKFDAWNGLKGMSAAEWNNSACMKKNGAGAHIEYRW